ncbi:MAG: efflux RND transporter periplasmic adaptor subunit [Candidatus Marinimicrobia bacterium]|jgi:membrane fusion protein, copper/silver efflux system|nr:efflux RND transporter periplasmic adaptor subunit [Candidatus Neomarinimicrobiota bacterium]MBT3575303.1 efflux RND transporter periplasmic adaptor subunit [Candidatus Neomarinimicrobiota bacterium]MBT3680402.1 efflux RND transporter periplasmic adaptor subunit [Candidatus Neomarinimicrobiota bacterium]MBT3951831.1 efflux RND transporter periplasmic adaptor subunit [Candidatus Neomarinimicrobiota bacterium]MBT4252735.1 efflux RND transporter periplasmic adaptor subunit [Candidatus Neomarini
MNELISKYVQIMKPFLSSTWVKTIATLILGVLLGSFLFSTGSEAVSSDHEDHSQGTIWTCSMDPQVKLDEPGQCPICYMDLIPLAVDDGAATNHSSHQGETRWTCSMHPQVKLDEPGQCPICFMDLIPLASESGSDASAEISLSAAAVKLAQISTTPVRHGMAHSEIHLSGKIDYDETRVKNIAAWFPGRLEHLYVDYTGIRVNRGDHLLEIYSPELYSTQSELLQAYSRMNRMDQSPVAQKTSQATYDAVVEKTKLLGLSMTQINTITSTGKARSVLQINSPITGVVIHKNAVEGKYVKTGEQIYSIADLSKVWLILEAYEKDLPLLTYGQELSFSVPGLPGQDFSAHISYIDPLVNPEKRSITVRAVLDNKQGLLKPGMLAEATVSVMLNGSGKVVTPDLSGKWACPMHPEVVENYPGDCSICGMDLVPLQEIGGVQTMATHALLIPASSVLKTGHRALVYVQTTGGEMSQFTLREIVLGPRAGSEYIVIDGLTVDELVVSNGNFKIDSAMQIAGKKSMMSGDGAPSSAPVGHQHG